MQIVRLRPKIEPDPKRPSLIVTVPGTGYKFAATLSEVKLALRREPKPMGETPVRSDAALQAPERRYVTALAAELAPARGGLLSSDPEDLGRIVGAFRHSVSEVVTRHGGVVGESRGREVFAYFGYARAQENDAERASIWPSTHCLRSRRSGTLSCTHSAPVTASSRLGLKVRRPRGGRGASVSRP